ncbi:MAG: hypothetical protein Q9220_000535 [cf. Caloplaca sp. 1 TL-2023]
MSSRVTRSSARLAADTTAAATASSTVAHPTPLPDPEPGRSTLRKRKAPDHQETTAQQESTLAKHSFSLADQGEDNETSATPATSSTRRAKKPSKRSEELVTKDQEDISKCHGKLSSTGPSGGEPSDDDDSHSLRRPFHEDDGEDPFRSSFLSHSSHPGGLSSTLRALSGMVTGSSSKLREILPNLKQKDDPSVQLIALQELSELLLVSTEDNLSGQFSPDQYIKELVILMQPNEFGEENPEMMLLACRCIANLMEALPPSTANVVYGGAVPVLCQKLLEIHYIDVAEQALSTLEKISVEFPSSVVREGGLTACLTYLDFFATPTQRSAVTTAANCCRNIPQDSFTVVKDVMPILLNVLASSDQKVVEQGSLCVSRIIESFKYQQDKLEELVSPELLRAIRGLLLPGTTNLIGSSIHTQFLRVLAITARASPSLSAELFRMSIVDTLFQILTGVSPPTGTEDVAAKIDGVVIMQALIHRPREHIFETLNVICELLPGVDTDALSFKDDLLDAWPAEEELIRVRLSKPQQSPNVKRIELLKGCKDEVKRFALILLPTLTDAYSSTVNLSVRQKVLTAHLKMLSNLDSSILEEGLRTVPYASYLASILSQQDHPSLVTLALQAAELLLIRLPSIYRYQFYREGVMAEIVSLAAQSTQQGSQNKSAVTTHNPNGSGSIEASSLVDPPQVSSPQKAQPDLPSPENDDDSDSNDGEDEDEQEEEEEEEGDDGQDADDGGIAEVRDDISLSPSETSSSDHEHDTSNPAVNGSSQDYVGRRAKKILEVHETAEAIGMRERALAILNELKALAGEIQKQYTTRNVGDGELLFSRLSHYLDGDALDSITSAELLQSGIVQVLLDVFSNHDGILRAGARSSFLRVFLNAHMRTGMKIMDGNTSVTAFSVLVQKLQDLLSRAELFEVLTVHQNPQDSNRSTAASMLSKQLRIRLMAEDETAVPRPYKNLMISIHAISTFKALDDYLRPRISLSERPRAPRHREGVSHTIAAFAAAAGMASPGPGLADRGEPMKSNSAAASTTPSGPTTLRSARKTPKAKDTPTVSENTPGKSTTPPVRRSSRRHSSSRNPLPETPLRASDGLEATLEIADERQLSDDDEEGDDDALDAIMDDLEDSMDGDQPLEPTAVNMEVASTGKVTARKEDGTRIATPSQVWNTSSNIPSSLSRELLAAGLNPSAASRAMSYAAAIKAVPQDWHVEFSINDKPIPSDTTIYRAVHDSRSNQVDSMLQNVWSSIHTIKFKRVQGPPPSEPPSLTTSTRSPDDGSHADLPASLHEHRATSSILRLLNILHELNANIDDIIDGRNDLLTLKAEPLSQFVNTKLTAKLNRQLEEPLIVASKCLPSWSEDLPRLYPFLFPFETRHLFLQSTSFGYARSMARWQNAQPAEDTRRERNRDDRPFAGRLQRQKVRIGRTRALESALKVMELYGASPSVLEVEYFQEVGTGLGPTLEFYATVSREFSKKETKMWREEETNDTSEYAFGKQGMFPAPISAEQADTENGKRLLYHFRMLGMFIARSMLDSRIIDVSLNPTFFRIGDQPSTVPLSLGTVRTIDGHLAQALKLMKRYATEKKRILEDKSLSAAAKAKALKQITVRGASIEQLGLDFTLPGYPSIELVKGGGNVPVTLDNVADYIDKVVDMTLRRGVQRQVDAFRAGFSQVFPYAALKAFTPAELVMLFGRVEEDWSIETLLDSIKADHGFNMDSRSVQNLLQVMSSLTSPQRRDFLQFVTGSPKLPIGGFKSLRPMFTVVCKPSEPPYTSDDFLVSVMTCANYVKLPDYSSVEILRKRLLTAIQEGQGAFHLS